ncbi:DUF4339 domain-containing protein [Stieleria sp. JC731]|uniref:DUF4339 domain-containing protein n=1 Tax=Pirellulaceae TaxID=2691357 RepID=UPI001E355FBB|nr:DUF4339 domain-containing protein [Stieleria sp. JC731]MCC9600620.1 DUF4339 domain-containing protein [Stieleria sp. JC731]
MSTSPSYDSQDSAVATIAQPTVAQKTSDSMQASIPEPAAEQPSASGTDVLTSDEPATWYVRPPSGGQYGPADTSVLRDWIDQGRVAKNALLWRDGWPQWREASEVLPEIADRLPGTSQKVEPVANPGMGKTKSIATEKTSPLDSSIVGTAKIGATRRKRANRRLTLVAVLGALVVGLVVTLVLVASAGA